MQSGVVGIDTVIYLRLYGQMRAVANVERPGCGGEGVVVQWRVPWPGGQQSRGGRLSRFDRVCVSLGACSVVWSR